MHVQLLKAFKKKKSKDLQLNTLKLKVFSRRLYWEI